MAIINPEKVADLIIEASEMHIMPRYQALEEHEISSKTSPSDLVTQADLDMEAHLKRVLPDLLPGSVIIGEEGISKGEDTLDVLKDDSQKVWVVDPVDGTRNFVNAKPKFGAMAACVIGGETQVSWIYDVLAKEMYIAEKTSGSYKNGTRLTVNTEERFDHMDVHINYRYFPKDLKDDMQKFISQFKSEASLGSSAHEYTRIAKGEADASFYSRSRVWDNLPGVLLVEESGGYVSKADKTDFHPSNDKANLIVTTSEENWGRIHQELEKSIDLKKYS